MEPITLTINISPVLVFVFAGIAFYFLHKNIWLSNQMEKDRAVVHHFAHAMLERSKMLQSQGEEHGAEQ